jgi:hypothetical protein
VPFLPEGPAFEISEVTKSLVHSGSLTPAYFDSIRREAAEMSKATSSDVWQDVFAIDQYGRLRPKHSILSALVAVPFYLVFGDIGFWIAQQIFFLSLLFSTYLIVERLVGRGLPWSTLLATCFLSQSIFYSYQYSYDLHACSLIVGGIALLEALPLAGGATMTLALFVRPALILAVLPLALAAKGPHDWRGTRRALTGIAGVLVLFLGVNYVMWGSPFSTSYSRLPGFSNGEMIMAPHPMGFDSAVLANDWLRKIYGDVGLVPYNLSILAVPFVVVSLLKESARWPRSLFLITAILFTLYIFSYPMWSASVYGNRFLFPAIYLYLFSFIPYVGRFEIKLKEKTEAPREQTP